jgi:predicted ATPase
MPVSATCTDSIFFEQASHTKLARLMALCFILTGLPAGADTPVLAQLPSRGTTPAGPIGASMAVLALLQDADVLPPEDSPDANRIIKSVIQFQSVFLKSDDAAVQTFLNRAIVERIGHDGTEVASRFRSTGWMSEVLEALCEQWVTTAINQRTQLAPGFRQFNVSLEDFDSFMGLVAKARTALEQRGQNLHQVFAQRRREMPGSTQ